MARLLPQRPDAYEVIGSSTTWEWQYMSFDADGKFYARHIMGAGGAGFAVASAHLVVDGAQLSTDRSAGGSGSFSSGFSISGTPAQWGLGGNKGSDLRSRNLGIAFSLSGLGNTTAVLNLTGIDMSYLTDDVTITSIAFNFISTVGGAGGGTLDIQITDVQMVITANITYKLNVTNEVKMLATMADKVRSELSTEISYDAMRKDGSFIGRIKRVTTNPSILSEINTLHSKMSMGFGQNDKTEESVIQEIMTEIQENMLTELGYKMVGSIDVPVGLGEGTNIDTNVYIDAHAQYGDWLPWLTEDGKMITTEDNKVIVIAEGFPDGRKFFGGYISNWELSAGNEDSSVSATVLSHSQELNNIVLETEDIPAFSHTAAGLQSKGIGGFGSGRTNAIAQTMTISGGSKYMSGIMLYDVYSPGNRLEYSQGGTTATITVRIYSGATTNPFGELVAIGSVQVPTGEFQRFDRIFVPFTAPIRLVSGSGYAMTINASGGSKDKNMYPYPAYVGIDTSAGFASGQGFERMTNDTSSYIGRSWDVPFMFYEQGGRLQRTFYSMDPSVILMIILDFARKKGARVSYTRQTIELTNTVVTLPINTNSIDEAVQAVLKTMPGDWHIWYDYATDEVHAHPRPTEVTQLLQRGVNVVGVPTLGKSIEDITNDVIFSGGELPSGENLLVRVQDGQSIETYRRGLKKISDSRFKDELSALLIARGEIERNSKPEFYGSVRIVQVDKSLLDLRPGELSQYMGFSPVMDTPELQIVAVTNEIESATLKLNVLKPRTAKRIEDIKRNLANLEAENNPESAS